MTPLEFARGSEMLDLGRASEAEQYAKQHLASDPNSAEAHLLLAYAYNALNRSSEALTSVNSALALSPRDFRSTLAKAAILFDLKKWDDSIYECDRLLAQEPTFGPALQLRGTARMRSVPDRIKLERLKRYEETTKKNLLTLQAADEDLRRAIELNPSSADAHSAMSAFAIRNEWWATARDKANEALRIDPNNSRAHLLLGLAQEGAGNVRGASESYVRAGQADKTSSAPLEQLKRLGTPVAGGIGFLGYLVVRTGVVGARNTGGIAAGVFIALIVLGLLFFVFIKPRLARNTAREQNFSDDARELLERDREMKTPFWKRLGR